MEIITVLILSVGLAMDAFAVSSVDGLVYSNLSSKKAFFIAGMFALFQMIMPVLGYYLGKFFYDYIKDYDHWIAFVLLMGIGIEMIIESIMELKKPQENRKIKCFCYRDIVIQSVATSIDAFAVGISLVSLSTPLLYNIANIGVVTFILSTVGIFFGKKINNLFKGKVEITQIIGGLILILIGINILLNHLYGIGI